MENFELPLIGGVLIAVSTSLMLIFNGKITGISGILGNCLSKVSKKRDWQYMFLAGLLIGSAFMFFMHPQFFNYDMNTSYFEVIIAGLLVGYGTRLGRGCTSGHGICGVSRFSKRSLTSAAIFMSTAILTAVVRGLL